MTNHNLLAPHKKIFLLFFFILFLSPCYTQDFYWENPELVSSGDSHFPVSAENGTVAAVLWQEFGTGGGDTGVMWLSMRVFDGSRWHLRHRFAGPYPYAGIMPAITSMTIDSRGNLLVAAATGLREISVFSSSNLGLTFRRTTLTSSEGDLLNPRIFSMADGSYMLFAAQGDEENFFLVASRSEDAQSWENFSAFQPAEGLRRSFLPSHASAGGKDYLVFQAFHNQNGSLSFQLYATVSENGGRAWLPVKQLSVFDTPGQTPGETLPFYAYHNQRASLQQNGGKLYVAWERSRTTRERYAIYFAEINPDTLSFREPPEAVTQGEGIAYYPDMCFSRGTPVIVWFDNRYGANRVFMAVKSGLFWRTQDLSKSGNECMFARVLPVGNDLEVYWQRSDRASSASASTAGNGPAGIFHLAPDHFAAPPSLTALNFRPGVKTRSDTVSVRISAPEDSSGIAGLSYAWGYGFRPDVPRSVAMLPSQNVIRENSDTDGSWFFGARVMDYAGNWSEPAYLEFVRDTTPPAPPEILLPETDGDGFLTSNTASVAFQASEDDEISGYTWRLSYMDVLSGGAAKLNPASENFQEEAAALYSPPPPATSRAETNTSVSFNNSDNGLYALSVSAVDRAGNISAPAVFFFMLNKYIPRTYISYVDSDTDEAGVVTMSIVGRGFSQNGLLTEVIFDRDGAEPYDLVLTRERGEFSVDNDRLVSDILLTGLPEGEYRIGLRHPVRGLSFSAPLLSLDTFGTVKFGDFTFGVEPDLILGGADRPTSVFITSKFAPQQIAVYALILFLLCVFFASIYGLSTVLNDSARIRRDVRALMSGDVMPSQKKKHSLALKKKGRGLRFKLVFFTGMLVFSIVMMVSIPLGLRFFRIQERTLAEGLQSKVTVLLESLALGARAYLPGQNLLELSFLPAQSASVPEALNAVITGPSITGSAEGVDFVWATNDTQIADKIDTSRYQPGVSKFRIEASEQIARMNAALNEQAVLQISDISENISALTQEAISLALRTDSASVERRNEIQGITRQLEERLNETLTELSSAAAGSYPAFYPDRLPRDITRYVFYKPVLFRQTGSTSYVHGNVIVEISTEEMFRTLQQERNIVIMITGYTALIAILIGVLGALVLAFIIISPLRRLAAHVAMIRDTDDKSLLEGKEITLRSKDEIGLLGETVNEMTQALVTAALAAKELTVGKETQKMFIPLETDSSGRKLTYGKSSDENAEFFGYYEGAKGVSGDYFDYIKLDDRHYAVIKCDVAGKGVPAALIMVEVATIFLNFFSDWNFKKNRYDISTLVGKINDLVESRGFKSRFAAFTICLFDSVSGEIYFCNAGDNIVHIYDAEEQKLKTLILHEVSAAGVFPTFMIDMKGGFQVEKARLKPGDVLFLYTDGIEEAKRMFRTADFRPLVCAEENAGEDGVHGNHTVGQDNEEFTYDRVRNIIEAVFNRGTFTLRKWHNPEGEEKEYSFDFSNCEGTPEEAVTALVAVEKVFRIYRDPAANDFDRVMTDRSVDAFLQKCFEQYEEYFSAQHPHPEYKEYLYYANLKEDPQYDDLTILGIKKK